MRDIQSRREFLRTNSVACLAAIAAPSMGRRLLASTLRQDSEGTSTIPMIALGKSGRVLPRLGFGAFQISELPSEERAIEIVSHAIRLGIRYFDTAPSYGNGKSESRIGKAVNQSNVKRSEFYIATKTLERNAAGARRELDESLKHLETDYVDSVQVHAVHDDFESLFAEDSVLKGLEKARDEGLIRHIGITGHANPEYLVKCIKRYPFVTALVPINPIDTKHLSFTRGFLPVAIEQKVGVIAMKVLASGSLLRSGKATARELLQYALSQPGVDIVLPGFEAIEHINEATQAMSGFDKPLDAAALKALEEKVGPHEGRSSEWYKDRK